MRVGVLALQGAFNEHVLKLEKMGIEAFEIRCLKDFNSGCDGLIIPGGESTVIIKLLKELEMFDPIVESIKDGLPVFGTCAGLILLSKKIVNYEQLTMELMDIEVKRNAYGRQLGSFDIVGKFNNQMIPMVFIRAPYIEKVNDNVEILSMVDNKIVAARQDNMLVTAFHPELTDNNTIYEYFIKMFK